jgi:hypothetical protein
VSEFKTPLHRRMKLCNAAKERYWRNPETRIAVINASRVSRGAAPINSLADMGDPKLGRRNAKRDERGRFA